MAPYCTVDDLMLEALPMNTVLVKQKYVDSTADEIDVILADRYNTPIVLDANPANRKTKLFLKQCNAQLATGRIIIAVALTNEQDGLNAYGRQMVNTTLAALKAVAGGEGDLPGTTTNASSEVYDNKILTAGWDSTSKVRDFETTLYPGGFGARNRPWLFGEGETRRSSGG